MKLAAGYGHFFGLVNAGQSLGQLIIAPLAGLVVVNFGWTSCIYFLCLTFILIIPCSFILRSKSEEKNKLNLEDGLGLKDTLSIAFKTPSYIYLISGFLYVVFM